MYRISQHLVNIQVMHPDVIPALSFCKIGTQLVQFLLTLCVCLCSLNSFNLGLCYTCLGLCGILLIVAITNFITKERTLNTCFVVFFSILSQPDRDLRRMKVVVRQKNHTWNLFLPLRMAYFHQVLFWKIQILTLYMCVERRMKHS